MKRGMERLITRRKLQRLRRGKTIPLEFGLQHENSDNDLYRNVHIVDIAWVRHLLDVDSSLLFSSCYSSDDALFYNILEVGETAPNVPQVLKWVSSGARVPVPKAMKGLVHRI